MSKNGGVGAIYLGHDRCRFLVWAPFASKVEVSIVAPGKRIIPMEPLDRGYHRVVVDGVALGTQYFYRLDGKLERPDPASRSQPEGVHGPSEVIESNSFSWEDRQWFGLPLRDFVIYELHVGTYTPEGTFEAIISHLDDIRDLGVTAVELMPMAQFPGSRNWGYDGAYPYAVQNSYGGPPGLKQLVNACHLRGIAVILDVVFNHLGPEGNYLGDFAPYFTEKYRTPWGRAINYDGPFSDEVRRFFVGNALYWMGEFHVDALRLDAIDTIKDSSAQPFLQQLATAAQRRAEELNRRFYLIAECDLNDPRVIRPRELGGYGLDAVWADDFHHALHTVLTGERSAYYEDFGRVEHLVAAFRRAFVYTGQYSSFRRHRHGDWPHLTDARQFVVFSQNHDQVGNRAKAERLTRLVSFDALKLASGVVLLSPFVPLLFMGEEYAEPAPFEYFVSHSDEALIEAVRKGRREEHAAFFQAGEAPDPQDEATFVRSKLRHELRNHGEHRVLRDFYKELILLRKEAPSLAHLSKENMEVLGYEDSKMLVVRRWINSDQALVLFNFGEAEATAVLWLPPGPWRKRLDSSDRRWLGGGSEVPELLPEGGSVSLTLPPKTFALYLRQEAG